MAIVRVQVMQSINIWQAELTVSSEKASQDLLHLLLARHQCVLGTPVHSH
jgi:hypothetical protein